MTKAKAEIHNHSPHNLVLNFNPSEVYKKKSIAISVDFSAADEKALQHAIDIGGKTANYTLIHVVETVGALIYGSTIVDYETLIDEKLLMEYYTILSEKGFSIDTKLGYGKPGKVIPKIINEGNFDILIMGTHGHTGWKDLLFGTTVDNVRHKIEIPLFIIKN